MHTVRSKFIELKSAGYTYLGYENGWKEEPQQVHIHKSSPHETPSLHDGRGDHLYWCDHCKIYWQMDSSD